MCDLETLNERVRGLGFANEIMRYLVQGAEKGAAMIKACAREKLAA